MWEIKTTLVCRLYIVVVNFISAFLFKQMSISLPVSLIIRVFKFLFLTLFTPGKLLTDDRFHDASKFQIIFSLPFEILKVWMVLELKTQTSHVMNVTVVSSITEGANAPDWNVAMRDRWSGYFQTRATHTHTHQEPQLQVKFLTTALNASSVHRLGDPVEGRFWLVHL